MENTTPAETQEQRATRTRAEWIQGLRDLAQLFESKPELPLPYRLYLNEWVGYREINGVRIEPKERMAIIAKALAPVDKEYSGDSFSLSKKFGPHSLNYSTSRNNVCVAKVVGKKMVEAQESRYYPEVPAHEEDILEWECMPLLAETWTEVTEESE